MRELRRPGRRLSEAGQNLIETAIVMPLLLLLLAGALDLGRAFNAYIVLTNAAREGARYGTLYPTDTANIKAWTQREARAGGIILNTGDITPTVTLPITPGDPVRVDVGYQLPVVMLNILGRSTIQIKASIEMPIVRGE